MKINNLLFLLLILSVSMSCNKDDEPTINIAQDIQNGSWESAYDEISKFNGTSWVIFGVDLRDPNAPCKYPIATLAYAIEGNTLTWTDIDLNYNISIEGDVLTIDSDQYNRIEDVTYPDC